MLTIQGIYDGDKFVALENFPSDKRFKVIITFLEEVDEEQEIRNFTAQTNALQFWEDEREDIYQDYLDAAR
ncbi:MAG: hypothetical protein SFU99_11900 [Saprospiraceae bacterium]|nr:hypothetical protein [Saprospiraceae bacterium]